MAAFFVEPQRAYNQRAASQSDAGDSTGSDQC